MSPPRPMKGVLNWFQNAIANFRGDARSIEQRMADRSRLPAPLPSQILETSIQTPIEISPPAELPSIPQTVQAFTPAPAPTPPPIKRALKKPPPPVDPILLDMELSEDFGADDGGGMSLDRATLVERWRFAITDPRKCWALFAFGTVVVFDYTPPNPRKSAEDVLIRRGRDSDMAASPLPDSMGWVAYGSDPRILAYVGPEEVESDAPNARIVDIGRAKIGEDTETRVVIHVQPPSVVLQ